MDEVNGIVDWYGAMCESCDPMSSDYIPFADEAFQSPRCLCRKILNGGAGEPLVVLNGSG
jgi:hypothetical protein